FFFQAEDGIRDIGVTGVQTCALPIFIGLSEPVLEEHQELKRFLRTKLYNHPKVKEVMDEARATLMELFEAYFRNPSLLPVEHQMLVSRADAEGGTSARARVVADYVAGMTDRFAYMERERISTASIGSPQCSN